MNELYLRDLVAQALQVPLEEVTGDAGSDTLEAWDSLGHLEVVLAVEQATKVKFSTQEIPQLTSLAKLEEALDRHGWNG